MADKILVAYATKYGSTEEVARKIAETLSRSGAKVDILPARKVSDIRPYRLVVLGTAIRMSGPLKEALAFASKFREDFANVPVALFSVGLQMKEDTPENREKTLEFLTPLREIIKEPVSLGLFGGMVEHRRFGIFLRFFARREKTGILAEGDWRDWDAIQRWAEELAARFPG